MIDKFYIWFGKNRKTIGLAIIILLLVSSIMNFVVGDIASGALLLVVAFVILMDVRTMP
jgi:hypothetical protein